MHYTVHAPSSCGQVIKPWCRAHERSTGPFLCRRGAAPSSSTTSVTWWAPLLHLPIHLSAPVQAWRGSQFFDDVFKLVGVPVITVQLRYDGWVTEMQV